LYPDSSSNEDENDDAIPLLPLHQKLEEASPSMGKDQTKGSNFCPYMTLPQFENLDDAMAAKKRIETDFPNAKLEFVLDRRVYLLRRQGDNVSNSCGLPKSDWDRTRLWNDWIHLGPFPTCRPKKTIGCTKSECNSRLDDTG
jgi:hypothetical protein